jgi:hypothetical protein
MKKMKHNILESVLGQVEFRPADPPDIQDVPSRDFESGRVSSIVENFFRSRMSPNDSGKLFSEIDTYHQRSDGGGTYQKPDLPWRRSSPNLNYAAPIQLVHLDPTFSPCQ